MSLHIVSNCVIVSPLEVRHFVLTLPHLKSSLQLGAVTYALRPLYPGNTEYAEIDFRYGRNGTVGIITTREYLAMYRKAQLPLVSSSLAAAYAQQTGSAVCISGNWAEFLTVKNGLPCTIECVAYNGNTERLASFAENFFNKNIPVSDEEHCFCVYMMPDVNISNIDSIPQLAAARKIQFEKIITAQSISVSEIYSVQNKKRKNSRLPYYIFAICALCTLVCADITLYIAARQKTAVMLGLKREYEAKKKETSLYEKQIQSKLAKKNDMLTERLPVYAALTEIRNSGVIWLNSFVYTDTSFRIEGEGASALSVFEKIQKSEIFFNTLLHQVSPSEMQGDRYIISGNIRND